MGRAGEVFERARIQLREVGLVGCLRSVVARFRARDLCIFVRAAGGGDQVSLPRNDLEVKWIDTPAALRRYAAALRAERGRYLLRQAEGRLAAGGSVLALALVEGRVAGLGWLRLSEPRHAIGCTAEDAQIFDCVTFPSHRGQGIYPTLLCHMVSRAGVAGKRRVFVWCRDTNEASRRGILKAGFQEAGRRPIADVRRASLCTGPHSDKT